MNRSAKSLGLVSLPRSVRGLIKWKLERILLGRGWKIWQKAVALEDKR